MYYERTERAQKEDWKIMTAIQTLDLRITEERSKIKSMFEVRQPILNRGFLKHYDQILEELLIRIEGLTFDEQTVKLMRYANDCYKTIRGGTFVTK